MRSDVSTKPARNRTTSTALQLIIAYNARRRISYLNPSSHLLQPNGQRFDLLLLLLHCGLKGLYLAMLFQELVEQHRVHRVVAHGAGLPIFVMNY